MQSLQLYSPICMYALPQHNPTLVTPDSFPVRGGRVCKQQSAIIMSFLLRMLSTCKVSTAQMEALQRNKGQLSHANHVGAVPVMNE